MDELIGLSAFGEVGPLRGRNGGQAQSPSSSTGEGAPDKGRACGGPLQTGPHAIIGRALAS
eukprot:scaffold14006_cov114-Isochrysis_galbana.AAC.1